MTDKDKISNGRGVKTVSQGTGRTYEIDVGRASEGGVDMGLSWPADTDECVVSWSVQSKLSRRVRGMRKYQARELVDAKIEQG